MTETNAGENRNFLQRNLDHIIYGTFVTAAAVPAYDRLQEKYGDNPTRFFEAGIMMGGMLTVCTVTYYLWRHYFNQEVQ